MKMRVSGLIAAVAILAADSFVATGAGATGSLIKESADMAPKVTLLSRSFRWQWDPFRVEGDKAYAVAYITNNHQYSLTLKTYCKDDGKILRPLSGWYSIAPGETFEWDTRRLVSEAKNDLKTIVSCKFWIDGSVDLRGQIVNLAAVRMGLEGMPRSLITFNYSNFNPEEKG